MKNVVRLCIPGRQIDQNEKKLEKEEGVKDVLIKRERGRKRRGGDVVVQ